MGSGIANVSAANGMDVLLKDMTHAALGHGEREVWKDLDRKVRRGALLPFERDRIFSRITGTLDYSGFARADLVIEAVFEDLDLKRRTLAEIEDAAPAGHHFRQQHVFDPHLGHSQPGKAPGAGDRHALLLAGPEDAPAGDRRYGQDSGLGQGDLRRGGHPAGQARDRGQGRPGLLHHPDPRAFPQRGDGDARGRRGHEGDRRRHAAVRVCRGPYHPARRGRDRCGGACLQCPRAAVHLEGDQDKLGHGKHPPRRLQGPEEQKGVLLLRRREEQAGPAARETGEKRSTNKSTTFSGGRTGSLSRPGKYRTGSPS